MNKLETLPRSLDYKGKPYFLRIHVNFRNQIVIQYSYDPKTYILSYVVQPELEPYDPRSIESSDGQFNENIGNCRTLDDCIDKIKEWIDKLGIEAIYYEEKKNKED